MAQTCSGQALILYTAILLSYPQYMIDVAFFFFFFFFFLHLALFLNIILYMSIILFYYIFLIIAKPFWDPPVVNHSHTVFQSITLLAWSL